MASLQPDLQNRLRTEFLRRGEFVSYDNLRAVFSDPRLQAWQSNVPSATSSASLVSFIISNFMDSWNANDDNVLALILVVLADVGGDSNLYQLAREVQLTLVNGKIAECERELRQVYDHKQRGWSDPAYANRRVIELQALIDKYNLKKEETMAFNQSGQAVKYQVNMQGTAIGVVGDGAHITGGLTMGGSPQNTIKKENVTMVDFNDFNTKALSLQAIRDMIALRKEFGLTVPESLLEDGRRLRRQVEASAAAEKETYATKLKQELREVETAKERRARLERELADLGDSSDEI